jgi:two-component system sensor histidine kinase MprB
MKLRTRIALIASLAVAVAVVLASVGAYFAARNELRDQVDESLVEVAGQATGFQGLLSALSGSGQGQGQGGFGRGRLFSPRTAFDAVYVQALLADGTAVYATEQELVLPIDGRDVAVVAGGEAVLRDLEVDGRHLRMITVPHSFGAVQVARSLDEMDETLSGLTVVLALVSAGGIGLAAALGVVVARGAVGPIGRLTEAAEHVAETQKFEAHIDIDRDDEIGRLATSFNSMLAALEESQQQQRRLVHDAGHELRTPLTALRTNIELLAKAEDLPADERKSLLDDVTFELKELSNLVTEVVDLATDAATTDEVLVTLRFDDLVDRVVERARRRTGREIVTDLEPWRVEGRRVMLERAVANLVDNAVKWSPSNSAVEVTLAEGRLAVRDHGAGIAVADQPRVFDRFYRSETARSTPGSGLGLSIVKRVAEDHGGTVFASDADGGGALVGFVLPAPEPMQQRGEDY